MSTRAFVLGLVLYFAVLETAGLAIVAHFRLVELPQGEMVVSAWQRGSLVARSVLNEEQQTTPELERASSSGAALVREKVIAKSPVCRANRWLFALSFVPGMDGIRATHGQRSVYVTPDELLSRQAYDHGPSFDKLLLTPGLDLDRVVALLGERLGMDPVVVLERASIERVRMVPWPEEKRTPTAASLSRQDVTRAISAAAGFLARSVDEDGRLRYLIDATTGEIIPGYNWPRHAGATYFLAQAAGFTKDPAIAAAARRAAHHIRQNALSNCGQAMCVGRDAVVDLGSSALTALAFAEIIRNDLDRSYTSILQSLVSFIRNQQRPDGEFKHRYQIDPPRAIDTQGLYYSSEAVLALARTFRVLRNPADLDAAARGLDYLVGPGWSFFGSRYYLGEEHWTCQAMGELWAVAPSPKALDFCLRWTALNRQLQHRERDAPYDIDGAHGIASIVTPRLTPIASRCEAGVATLEAARAAGVEPNELSAIEQQMRRALAYLLRHQFLPGRTHLFADPALVHGAFPGSRVDWKLRIDYAQHAGSALIRWLEVTATEER